MTERRQAVVAELMLEVSCLRDETEALRNKVAALEKHLELTAKGGFEGIQAIARDNLVIKAERDAYKAKLTDTRIFLSALNQTHDLDIEEEVWAKIFAEIDSTLNPVPDSGK